ncbi:MAG TPA: hypothetical protein PLJ78_01980 [Anaerolineae bacterium]|nr:hypothetical protein [Anaerolineae bacterium]HQK12693.1 hypothetical protein [Anaerolineae bacterium]
MCVSTLERVGDGPLPRLIVRAVDVAVKAAVDFVHALARGDVLQQRTVAQD